MKRLTERAERIAELMRMRDPERGDHARAVELLINMFYGDRDGFLRHHLALLKNIGKDNDV